MRNINGKILALITAQPTCERIIKIADDFANGMGCEVDVITVQPLKATAEKRSEDMICLTKLSKKTSSNIKIIYSDFPLKAILKEISKIEPIHIFVGQGREQSKFLTGLRLSVTGSPISVIGTDEIIYTIPGVSEDSFVAHLI